MKIRDTRRLGLVEVEIEGGKVVLSLCPPGAKPVSVTMEPADARSLATGIREGADEAERPALQARDARLPSGELTPGAVRTFMDGVWRNA